MLSLFTNSVNNIIDQHWSFSVDQKCNLHFWWTVKIFGSNVGNPCLMLFSNGMPIWLIAVGQQQYLSLENV